MVKSVMVRSSDGYKLAATLCRGSRTDCVVIWLHGISVDKDEHLGFFRDGANYLLNKGISSVRFDFRGHGESEGTSVDFSVVGQILDVRAILRLVVSEFGSQAKIHIVAASFGSPAAIFIAIQHPELIKSLCLIAPVLSYRRTFLEPETEWAKQLFSQEKLQQLEVTGRLYLTPNFYISPRLVEEMRLLSPDIALRDITQPVLIIHGDKDSMVPYDVSAQVCRELPSVRLVTLSGADHGFIHEGDEEGLSIQSINNKETIYRIVEEQIER